LTESIVEMRNVSFHYPDFDLADVSLKLEAGERRAVVGRNGSGKTTMFKLMVGLLRPDSGEILILGKRLSHDTIWEARSQIGFLFQNPGDQLFAPTVWEDVSFGPRNLGLSKNDVEERVRAALNLVGMLGFEERPVNRMSFGQAKRIALAGIIAMRPRVLILDEPFSGLDFQMIKTMVETVERMRREGTSVVYTTHSAFFLENWADSVTALEDGRVVFDGPGILALTSPVVSSQIGDWQELVTALR